jgi:iron complex outermembrane recepter protein
MSTHQVDRGVRPRALASAIAAILSAGMSGEAISQDAPQSSLEQIVVTGSRIVRRDFEANSPILTVEQEMFDNTMSVGIETVLNQLPQFVPAVSQFQTIEVQATATVTPGASTLSLRGLGANRNLVLIDGRRAMPVNASGAVNTNTIPAAAIARVETITGGASSVYGADAMAGVVNFITKKDFEGIDFDVRYGQTEEGDGGEFRLAGLYGANVSDGDGNVMLGFEYSSRDPALQRNRDFVVESWADPRTTVPNVALGATAYVAPAPSNTNPLNPTQAAVNTVFADRPGSIANVGNGNEFFLNPDGSLFRERADGAYRYRGPTMMNGVTYRKILTDLDPAAPDEHGWLREIDSDNYASIPLERYALFGRARSEISDNVTGVLQGNFSQDETSTLLGHNIAQGGFAASIPHGTDIYAPSRLVNGNTNPDYLPGGRFGLSCAPAGGCTNSQAFPTTPELAQLLDSRGTANAPWALRHNTSLWNGKRTSDNRVTSYQIMAGLEGTFEGNDWTWDAYLSHGSTQVATTFGGFGAVERWRTLVTQPNYGRGAAITGNAAGGGFGAGSITCTSGYPIMSIFTPSQDCIDAFNAPMQNTGTMDQTVVEANVQGKLFDMPAGEARFAVGTDYRENTFTFLTDILNSQQSFLDNTLGLFPAGNSNGEISAREIYGEALLPLVANRGIADELSVEIGYRYSDHEPTGPVETYKGMIDWGVNDRVRVRGGRQVANRAPNIGELFLAKTQTITFSTAGDLCAASNFFSPLSAFPVNPGAAQARALCQSLMTPAAAAAFYSTPQATGFGLAFANTSGNLGLEHETAETITLGTVISFRERTSLTIDFWEIGIANMIASQSVDSIYTDCFSPLLNPGLSPTTAACTKIIRDPVTGARQPTDATYVNDGAIETRGIDLQFDWGTDLGPGSLALNFLITYLDSVQTRVDPDARWQEWKGTFGPTDLQGVTGGSHDYRTFTTLSYFPGNWNVSLRWRHLPSIKAASAVTAPATNNILPTDAYDVFDVSGGLTFREKYTLRFGVDNVFAVDPPTTNATLYNPGNFSVLFGGAAGTGFYDNLGRRAYVGLGMSF